MEKKTLVKKKEGKKIPEYLRQDTDLATGALVLSSVFLFHVNIIYCTIMQRSYGWLFKCSNLCLLGFLHTVNSN